MVTDKPRRQRNSTPATKWQRAARARAHARQQSTAVLIMLASLASARSAAPPY